MKYKAVIFDLDGTLLNTLDDLADSVNFALSQFSLPTRTKEETRLSVGNGIGRLIELSIPHGKDNPLYDAVLDKFTKYYFENSDKKTAPYCGISELLAELKSKGITVGVVSNKFDAAVKALCEKYFPSLIDIAVGESASVRRKPYPDSLLKAIDSLGLLPSDCIYVGDSETDVMTAAAANIPCISVLWGFRDKETLIKSGADCFIETPKQLFSIIF